MNFRLFWIPVTVALFTAGSAAQYPIWAQGLADNPTSPLMSRSRTGPPAMMASSEVTPNSELSTAPELTPKDALEKTLGRNPALASLAVEIRARDSEAFQAGGGCLGQPSD